MKLSKITEQRTGTWVRAHVPGLMFVARNQLIRAVLAPIFGMCSSPLPTAIAYCVLTGVADAND